MLPGGVPPPPTPPPPLLLFSPTEHALMALEPLNVSSIPETHGCDVLTTSPAGFVGYQRKTLPDLSASIIDGRLAKEFGQITSSGLLAHALNIGYLPTTDPSDTLRAVRATTAYLARRTSTRLVRPKAPRDAWGRH